MYILIKKDTENAFIFTTLTKLAKEIGVSTQTLRRWKKDREVSKHKGFTIYFYPSVIRKAPPKSYSY